MSTRWPLRMAGTRYAIVLPVPVPASAIRMPPPASTVSTSLREAALAGARLELIDRLRQRTAVREGRVDRCQPWRSGYRGKFRHNRSTSAFTIVCTPSSSGAARTREMYSAMRSISGSRMPRVVTAGVPMRMPLATIGGF